MEYCEIGSLASVMDTLRRSGMNKLQEEHIAALLYQTARGLAFLHKDDIKVVSPIKNCLVVVGLNRHTRFTET